MSITNTTFYTFEVMMAFHRHHRKRLQWVHIALNICYGFYLTDFALLCVLSLLPAAETTVGIEKVVFALASAAFLILDIASPRILARQIRKNPAFDARVDYAFYDEVFTEVTQGEKISESSTVHYAAIHRVTESETAIYLYINSMAAHIIDKRGFTSGDVAILKQLLRDRVDPKKIKLS
jgi:hypothetical protein